jgi:hypothetical protein
MKTKFSVLLKRHVECLFYLLFSPLRWLINLTLQSLHLVVIAKVTGGGIGDTLCATTILNILHHRRGVRGIAFSKNPEIFAHNSQVALNLDYEKMPKLARSLLKSACKYMSSSHIRCFGVEAWTPGTLPWRKQPIDENVPHYYELNQPDHRYRLDTDGMTPCIMFGTEEIQQYQKKFAALPPVYGVIKASGGVGRQGRVETKNWRVERMEQVIARYPDFPWVQIGQEGEPIVANTINLLGQTNLREIFYILSCAKVVLTIEGLISHTAPAFAVPTVVVFSSDRLEGGLKYPSTIPVYANPRPPCAPCWQESCHIAGKPCTENITVDQVVQAVELALNSAK